MTNNNTAKLDLGDKQIELPVLVGSENEHAVDITQLRSKTGYITLDSGFGNTGSCQSAITYIDGEKGILRYRGIPIEQLAQKSTFVETAQLLIYGELPTQKQTERFSELLSQHQRLHERVYKHFGNFPSESHPMAVLSSMINAVSCHHPDILEMEDEHTFDSAAARLISKVRTIAAGAFKTAHGEPITYPRPSQPYVRNFLHMMFSLPYDDYDPDDDVVNALRLFLILHADHEQNCSTSTVRTVASSGANLFASCAAGVCALWGPAHGGANMAVLKMLTEIHDKQIPYQDYMERVKKKEFRLMGFGHRVYKNFDPRAKILKAAADKILPKLGVNDPLLDIAKGLEEVALKDDYFISRNLYPNVDFYSGAILRAIGIPINMFTVMFAVGRMPGWIAQWKEQVDSKGRIFRPRQVYTGENKRDYVPMEQR
ncbi:MAG: citrate (Si)-synthase [Gammaproteobacteria bacterium]|nr:MAG: citrate (Si)-synthase [Gammaproteobacteria bacterium]